MMPDTSLEAYADTKEIQRRQKEIVLVALISRKASTALELVKWLGGELDVVQVRRRLSDLQKEGMIQDSGQRRTSNGRSTIVWRLSDKSEQILLPI